MRKRSLLVAAVLVCACPAGAQLRPAAVFADHMVLQRGRAVPVWGWAQPGQKVEVSIAGQSVQGTADESGRWLVRLRPLEAGGPHELEIAAITGGQRHIEVVRELKIRDVLVGEVWVCSGQSNMEWPVRMAKDSQQEIAAADHPDIRLFKVRKTVAGEPLKDTTGGWKDEDWRWRACSPESVPGFSAVGYFFGRELHRALDVPVGLIQSAWGGTPAEAWTSAATMRADPAFRPILERWRKAIETFPERLARWREAAAKAKDNGERPPRRPNGPNHPHRVSGLYNGMIAPLQPLAIRGVIWYQGESNVRRAKQYARLFPALIRDWRQTWGRPDLPFLFVQLANFEVRGSPLAWAELREAQRRALALPHTGMAVTIDIGNPKDIHPRNKQEVGRRLALIARARVHGEDVDCSGPVYRSAKVEGGAVHVSFDEELATADGGEPTGFEIAGADGKWVPAKARIEGDTVVVEGPVEDPVAVRYAWTDDPEANLVDAGGLPASPFRTDEGWEWVTGRQR